MIDFQQETLVSQLEAMIADQSPIHDLEKILASIADVNCQIDKKDHLLFSAIKHGRLDVVSLLLTRGADPNVTTRRFDKKTPLHYAAEIGNTDIIDALLTNKANIEAENFIGQTPLDHAKHNNKTEAVTMLLAHGANQKTKFLIRETLRKLEKAITNKEDLSVIQPLLDLIPNVNAIFNAGQTLLFMAVRNEQLDLVSLLLTRGADLETKDWYENTPSHYAAMQGNMLILKELLQKKEHSKTTEIFSKNVPLDLVMKYLALEGAFMLLKHKKDLPSELQITELLGQLKNAIAKQEDLAVIESTLSKMLVFIAIEHNRLDVLSLLLARGADLEAKDHLGKTPLLIACELGMPEIVKELINRGADITAKYHPKPINYSGSDTEYNALAITISPHFYFWDRWQIYTITYLEDRLEILDLLTERAKSLNIITDLITNYSIYGNNILHLLAQCPEQGFFARDEIEGMKEFFLAIIESMKKMISMGVDLEKRNIHTLTLQEGNIHSQTPMDILQQSLVRNGLPSNFGFTDHDTLTETKQLLSSNDSPKNKPKPPSL